MGFFKDVIMSESKINPVENVRFIQQMLGELRTMAQNTRLHMLAYLIEIAYIEGSDQLRRHTGSDSGINQRNISA